MAKVLVTEGHLNNIAEAIRSKNGAATTYRPGDMAAAIQAIPTGITPTGTKQITANGTTDVTNYASANVQVPNTYEATDEGKVVSNGALVAQTSRTVTENGTYDTTENNELVVNVSGGGGSAAVINDNIAANWDFETPLNSRGQSSWSAGTSIVWTIDGWGIFQGGVEVVSGGIKVKKNASYAIALFQQRLKSEWITALLGKTVTISALVGTTFGTKTVTITAATGTQGDLVIEGLTFYFYRDSSTQMPFYVLSNTSDTDDKIIRAVKVEMGSEQTLCHQENGVWVLNDETYNQDLEYVKTRAMLTNN